MKECSAEKKSLRFWGLHVSPPPPPPPQADGCQSLRRRWRRWPLLWNCPLSVTTERRAGDIAGNDGPNCANQWARQWLKACRCIITYRHLQPQLLINDIKKKTSAFSDEKKNCFIGYNKFWNHNMFSLISLQFSSSRCFDLQLKSCLYGFKDHRVFFHNQSFHEQLWPLSSIVGRPHIFTDNSCQLWCVEDVCWWTKTRQRNYTFSKAAVFILFCLYLRHGQKWPKGHDFNPSTLLSTMETL